MEIIGSQIIDASQEEIWSALNNPEILKKCLPGCESVEQINPDLFKVVITAAIGPLKAKFNGTLHVTEANPPENCVLVFEGQGGAVGFGKGSSSVTLKSVDGKTELIYSAKAHVGGKLAQIGSRLIDSVAKKMSDDFFKAFNGEVTGTINASTISTKITVAEASAQIQEKLPSETIKKVPTSSSSNEKISNTVPAWWLFIAVALGSGLTIAANLLMHS